MPAAKKILVTVLIVVLLGFGIASYRSHNSCKQRSNAFNVRIDNLRRAAEQSLPRGSTKGAVIHFFAANGIPIDFDQDRNEATGTVYTTGCGPSFACGDSALIGVKIQFDSSDRLQSKEVVGMYCL